MGKILKIKSTPRADIGMALGSWETLTVFDIVTEIDNILFKYTVDGFIITLRSRGTYDFKMLLNLKASTEISFGVEILLNVGGVDYPLHAKGWSENSISFWDNITVEEETDVIIKAQLISEGTPDIECVGEDLLMITKII